MKLFKRYTAFLLMLIMVFSLCLTGCGEAEEEQAAYTTEAETLVLAPETEAKNSETAENSAAEQAAYATETETAEENAAGNEAAGTEETAENTDPENNGVSGETAEAAEQENNGASAETDAEGNPLLDEYGSYYQKDEVALYIHQYGKLPENYITKKEAESLGWSGGSLEKYAPGKVIGGSKFGNYEGNLPKKKGRQYYECDIDSLAKKRGAKRIVFSDDGLIYYTDDHYETFELLYGEE